MFSLPVIVYHHVNNLGEDITESQFEEQVRYLADAGYRTVFLSDWVIGDITADGKTVAITFDDGFLDNWVYAYPILKKYELKATIFVTTVRGRDDLEPRPNLEEMWEGLHKKKHLPEITPDWEVNRRCVLREEGSPDFLTWEEMRIMEASGHIDIQSHSHYHRDFFVSRDIVDFNQNKYFGVGWLTDGDTRFGIPIYPRKSAMVARRYFDDVRLRDFLAEKVQGPGYFTERKKREYLSELIRQVEKYKRMHGLRDRFESHEEQKNRIFSELALSKKLIEERLNKRCELFCWPWGEYSALSIRLAKEAGFKGAAEFSSGPNIRGTEAGTWKIKRFPPPSKTKEFARLLKLAATPRGAMALRVYEKVDRTSRMIARRIASGDFGHAARRKLGAFF